MKPRRPTTPGAWRQLERLHAVGRGWQLDLDTIPGVVAVRVSERGPGQAMHEGSAVVEVWGGDPAAVLRTVETKAPQGVAIVAVVREPSWGMRLRRWVRWRVYRFAVGRWGLRWLASTFGP